MLKMHPREKLPKLKLTSDGEESANRILDDYLHGNENIPEIGMGKATAMKSKMMSKETNSHRKNKPSNRNRREKVEG